MKQRLIDANKAKSILWGYSRFSGIDEAPYEYAEEAIDILPTIDAIPVEWLKNKRDELEKEYHDLFHAYTDEGMNDQVRVLNDLYAFRTALRYWEKENE